MTEDAVRKLRENAASRITAEGIPDKLLDHLIEQIDTYQLCFLCGRHPGWDWSGHAPECPLGMRT